MDGFRRIGLSLAALLLSSAVWSLISNVQFPFLYIFIGSFPFEFHHRSFIYLFFLIVKVSLPIWFLYLPFVLALKDAEERRLWTTLASGILIGPVCLAICGLILELRAEDAYQIWRAPILGFGVSQSIPFAFAMGFVTTGLYVIGLKLIHQRNTPYKSVN